MAAEHFHAGIVRNDHVASAAVAFFIHGHDDRDALAFGHPLIFSQGIFGNGGGQVRAFGGQIVQKLLVRFRGPVEARQNLFHFLLGILHLEDF